MITDTLYLIANYLQFDDLSRLSLTCKRYLRQLWDSEQYFKQRLMVEKITHTSHSYRLSYLGAINAKRIIKYKNKINIAKDERNEILICIYNEIQELELKLQTKRLEYAETKCNMQNRVDKLTKKQNLLNSYVKYCSTKDARPHYKLLSDEPITGIKNLKECMVLSSVWCPLSNGLLFSVYSDENSQYPHQLIYVYGYDLRLSSCIVPNSYFDNINLSVEILPRVMVEVAERNGWTRADIIRHYGFTYSLDNQIKLISEENNREDNY